MFQFLFFPMSHFIDESEENFVSLFSKSRKTVSGKKLPRNRRFGNKRHYKSKPHIFANFHKSIDIYIDLQLFKIIWIYFFMSQKTSTGWMDPFQKRMRLRPTVK